MAISPACSVRNPPHYLHLMMADLLQYVNARSRKRLWQLLWMVWKQMKRKRLPWNAEALLFHTPSSAPREDDPNSPNRSSLLTSRPPPLDGYFPPSVAQ